MFDRREVPDIQAETMTPEQQQLLRLNFDFLKLLRDSSATTAVAMQRQQLALSPTQSQQLAHCTDAGLQRMAQCNFSLFSLSLHRADVWQHIARNTAPSSAQYALPTTSADAAQRNGFMACALFFAWHLSQQSPRSARFLLGMTDDCLTIIAALELWQCSQIAHSQSHLLGARWQHHAYFWPDLLRYGVSGEMQHLKFARLMGSQLMAQELEPSAIMRLSSTD
jgi:hypothetical protein